MTINSNYPKMMLVELSGITSLIVHALNDLSKSRIVDNNIAYQIAIYALKRDIDMRCCWLLLDKVSMGTRHKEVMLNGIPNIAQDYIEYLISYGDEVFEVIEKAMSELLDKYIGKETWHVWSVTAYDNFSICLRDSGDFRIAEWAQYQELNNTAYAHRLSSYELGAEE